MAESSDAQAPALTLDLRTLLHSLATALETPLALLSRAREEWRFEGEAFPPDYDADEVALGSTLRERALAGAPLWEGLNAFGLGRTRGREWVLLIPGVTDEWRHRDKGFGFIRDEGGIEHFFHRSSVRGAVFELLREGQRVDFTPEDSQKGPRAGDVRLIES